mmetsp:Transcript_103686/g.178600  ORF Transcript_103686/g.178600 Transcript_103686/m.178600 type:complete len:86 (-) Transcript_103686:2913-3170(-)
MTHLHTADGQCPAHYGPYTWSLTANTNLNHFIRALRCVHMASYIADMSCVGGLGCEVVLRGEEVCGWSGSSAANAPPATTSSTLT